MPELQDTNVSYVCPKCRNRQVANFCYIPKKSRTRGSKSSLVRDRWCSRCGAKHTIQYSLEETSKGQLLFNLISFICEGDSSPRPRFVIGEKE